VEPERVRLEWVSASEGDRFARIVNEMTEQVRALGPFPGAGRSGSASLAQGGSPLWHA
jgi:F420-non-reducing hydrogenase iron-sulfur subunit